MKKLFAIFCAVILMPSFSSYAWIGGPFSNNTYFGEDGDDGVYEAVAIPVGGQFNNGIGMYRWGVSNQSAFSDDATISVSVSVFDDEGNLAQTFVDVRPVASNIYFGGTGQISHTWFIEGISYRGNCDGTANSGINSITCVGTATNQRDTNLYISSQFRATFENGGEGVPVSRFSGRGTGQTNDQFQGIFGNTFEPVPFRFSVFGSKVASFVTVNGTFSF